MLSTPIPSKEPHLDRTDRFPFAATEVSHEYKDSYTTRGLKLNKPILAHPQILHNCFFWPLKIIHIHPENRSDRLRTFVSTDILRLLSSFPPTRSLF